MWYQTLNDLHYLISKKIDTKYKEKKIDRKMKKRKEKKKRRRRIQKNKNRFTSHEDNQIIKLMLYYFLNY